MDLHRPERKGDGVELGAYVQVLGGVTLGDGCKVGAMSVVLADVPPGATAVGNPARIIAAAQHDSETVPSPADLRPREQTS